MNRGLAYKSPLLDSLNIASNAQARVYCLHPNVKGGLQAPAVITVQANHAVL